MNNGIVYIPDCCACFAVGTGLVVRSFLNNPNVDHRTVLEKVI